MNHPNSPDFQYTVLPTFDLGELDVATAVRKAPLSALREAAHTAGFFYLAGHGVQQALIDDAFRVSREFFDLPDAAKRTIENLHSPHFRGYTCTGAELTRGARDWREQLDFGAERPRRALSAKAPPWALLEGPNQWPDDIPALKPVVLELQAQLTAVALKLLRALAIALGQDAEVFTPLIADAPTLLLKLIRYPGSAFTDSAQGVGAHKDTGLLTFVVQHEQSGLQVQNGESWIAVPPRAGTLVVNIGEMLELASGGYLHANVHRVVTPAGQNDRLSIAYFLNPHLDARVRPIALPAALQAAARPSAHDPDNPLLEQVGLNLLKSQLRSHPEVARRYYAGVAGTVAGEGADHA
ncbi:isopenicillin N synthase family dioxygenase [Rhodocyclus tenuis]|uniref:2-oxoglutarate-dependent ethylene/succinate-forming enzyme n=1 Tax=Rhodocyclus tenuis TaxID=1066 RepID=A0A840GAT7_RHOTE|nr:2-oxoglutarate and iron-dependent oxygenase domain-containing protein [Rhodocyclus tenuis]MBB4248591.1 isopenicillin N synthase-like dioxygenase [Rhodocyclus tenuis]